MRSLMRNLAPVLLSLAVFAASFVALLLVGRANRPRTVDVLVLTRDVQAGETVAAADLEVATVPAVGEVSAFVAADERDQVVGGVALFPLKRGQLLPRAAVAAAAAREERLSAVLGGDPNGVLFPLPLDAPNVVAPPVDFFRSGDRVDLVAVAGARVGVGPDTPAEEIAAEAQRLAREATPPPSVDAARWQEAVARELARVRPPVAKSLFPNGLPVVRVVRPGRETASPDLEVSTAGLGEGGPALVLRVTPDDMERLAWALTAADQVVVALVAPTYASLSPGYTGGDFLHEALMDRLAAASVRLAVGGPAAPVGERWVLTPRELAALLLLSGREDLAANLAPAYPVLDAALQALRAAPDALDAAAADLRARGLAVEGAEGPEADPALAACLADLAAGGAACVLAWDPASQTFGLSRFPAPATPGPPPEATPAPTPEATPGG